ncbi:MAG TPA: hypothetical protein VHT27_05250 [Solirubrobacteraceae bacterium]|nr:hypothetical protein [Solirubrobacteraceae bacterium]
MDVELAPLVAARAADRVLDACRGEPEQLRHRRQQPPRVLAIVAVVAHARDVSVTHAYRVAATAEHDQLVGPVELRIRPDDVPVHERGGSEGAQGPLEAHRHGEVEGRFTRVFGDVGVTEHFLCRAPQRELRLVGEPAVLVAELLLRVGEPGAPQQLMDGVATRLPLHVGEDQARGQSRTGVLAAPGRAQLAVGGGRGIRHHGQVGRSRRLDTFVELGSGIGLEGGGVHLVELV